MARMHELVDEDSGHQAIAVEATPNLFGSRKHAEFISDYTLQVAHDTITAQKIFIVSGARHGYAAD